MPLLGAVAAVALTLRGLHGRDGENVVWAWGRKSKLAQEAFRARKVKHPDDVIGEQRQQRRPDALTVRSRDDIRHQFHHDAFLRLWALREVQSRASMPQSVASDTKRRRLVPYLPAVDGPPRHRLARSALSVLDLSSGPSCFTATRPRGHYYTSRDARPLVMETRGRVGFRNVKAARQGYAPWLHSVAPASYGSHHRGRDQPHDVTVPAPPLASPTGRTPRTRYHYHFNARLARDLCLVCYGGVCGDVLAVIVLAHLVPHFLVDGKIIEFHIGEDDLPLPDTAWGDTRQSAYAE
jgi:hypothetical protein